MTLPQFVAAYGYWAVLAGTLFEAETVLLLAGFAAHRGYLELPTVVGVAIVGSFLANQPWFYLGRVRGPTLLLRYPKYMNRVARAQAQLAKYHLPLIVTMRFVMGLRTVLPFVLGMSSMPTLRFQMINFAGAVFWSVMIGAGGYLFGHLVERMLGDLRLYEEILFAVLAVGGLAYWWYSRRRT